MYPEPAAQRSVFLLPVLLACSSLTVMAGATIAPGLPGLVVHFADYPDADYLARLILTAPGLAIALTALVAGWLADKMGRRVLLQGGVALYIVAGSAGLWLDDLILLLISRLLLGIAVGLVMVCSMALLTDHFQGPERNRAMGVQSSAMAGGAIVFISAGSILADVSWRAPFSVYLLPFFLFPLIYWFITKPPPSEEEPGVIDGRFPLAHTALLYALANLSMALFYCIPTQLPFYSLELGAQSFKTAGFAVVLSQMFSAVASANYQRLRLHLDNVQVLLVSYSFMACGFLILAFADSLVGMYCAMPFVGIGLGFNFPNLTIWLMSKVPSAMRGRAAGGMTTAVFTGQFISPFISQPLVVAYGFGTTYLVASVVMLMLVTIPCVLVLMYRHQRSIE